MSFSTRQVHLLQAMGLVAWTRNVESAPASEGALTHEDAGEQTTDGHVAELPQQLGSSAAAQIHDIDSAQARPRFAMPSEILALAEWILEQPLASFMYRGADVSVTGSEQAALMVICIQTEASDAVKPAQLPLTAECAQLLGLMLRAIDISATAVKHCAMFTHAPSQTQGERSPVYLDAIRTPHIRAVLVLDPRIDKIAAEPESDSCLMPVSSLPLWRVPHPEQLLQNPALKRRAWESLKGLKKALAS